MGIASDSQLRGPGFEFCAAVLLGEFVHSALLHITQLYKLYLVIDSGGYVCTSSFCAFIVAYGSMLPREVEMVFDRTGLSGT